MEDDCVFCKIVKGEIPSDILWEDEYHIAILDINPYAKGHVMIIPREHSRWVWDIDDEKYSKYMLAVKRVAGILRKAFGTDSVQEVIAGFGVAHVHIHLLPRTIDDGLNEIPNKPLEPKLSKKEIREISDKIKAVVK
jgi:histidine triad (HIT) family protein